MARSIKLKNNNYIDSTGVVHNRELLSNILNKQDTSNTVCIAGAGANITLNAGVGTRVTGLVALKDPVNMLSNDYIVVPKTGIYLIGYSARLGDTSGSQCDVFSTLRTPNSALYRVCSAWVTQINRLNIHQTAIVQLTAGDKLYLEVTSLDRNNFIYGGNNKDSNGCYIFCKYLCS